jgi:pSer/pThr/pTyr-binding forkhead associated (FHA) protein
MVHLTVFHNDEPIKTYEMDKQAISIGRLPENDIPIASISVSRRHVRIEQDTSGRHILKDLNSLNGSFVNNKKVKEIALSDGDKITLGKYSILFELGEDTIETADLDISHEEEVTLTQDTLAPESEAYIEELVAPEPPLPDIDESVSGGVLIETNKHVVYKLDKPLMTVGSSERDDIFVDGFLITDGHVLIEKDDEGTWIHANKLMGRFKVNGKKVNKHKLVHKDRIEIGSSTFRYMENGRK